jgi:hypothetical protein
LNCLRVARLAVSLFAAEAVSAAQEPTASLASVFTTGQRVRVHSITEPRHVVGGVSAVDVDFVTVIPDGLYPMKIPARSITGVDASRGHKRNWRKGLIVGPRSAWAWGSHLRRCCKLRPRHVKPLLSWWSADRQHGPVWRHRCRRRSVYQEPTVDAPRYGTSKPVIPVSASQP